MSPAGVPWVCSQGTCGPGTINCHHPGDKVEKDNVIVYLINSYAQWSWKIGETLAPEPIRIKMRARRKAKKKRLKEKMKNG